ncbi:hypothetical protein NEOLEDRAFT_270257 [Neolentinus lepideus HHB14362 ss-1]|uniref:Uncharacterized protein n=1 Tax=Neolentinus lepideus HHB14362 ss-1 TaxID=1314782 RepID=A0A165T3R9_9AGAM|nr:hypothetical protein NEOLEDRAFT_270257 [Neolentinus lepideus HHB14362 ss-1]
MLFTFKVELTMQCEQRITRINGQDILANLSKIKPTLVERYERWHGSQEHSDSSSPGPLTPQTYQEDPPIARRSRVEPFPIQEEDQYASVREKARERRIYDDTRGSSSDEEAKRRDTVEVARRRQADEYARRQQDDPRRREDEQRTREAAALAYRAREERGPVYGPRPMDGDAIVARMDEMRISNLRQQPSPNEDARRRDEETTRRREEEATRRRLDDRRREEAEGIMKRQQEAEAAARATRTQLNSAYVPPVLTSSLQSAYSQGQEGIAHRQREAEEAARVARQEFNASGLPVSAPPNMISSAQQAAAMREREESVRRQHEAEAIARAARPPATPTSSSALAAPTAVSTSQYQFLESHHRQGVPIMPLESPSKYEDDSSTDVSVTDGPSMPRQTMRRDKEPEQTPSKPPRRR